ncbi:MAG: hypothetical protein ABGX16_25780 [Pirellulales bacterium]
MLADRWLLRLFTLVACAVCCSGSTAQESADRTASAEQGISANAASAEQGLSANAASGERSSIPETTETSRPELKDRAALIQVRLPLVGSADQAIRRSVQRICDHLLTAASGRGDLRRPVLVIQLMPPSRQLDEVAGTSFERAYALARYLCSSELAGIRKVAFVPQTIRGHGTLLAMACEELIMAADAEIGEASIEKQGEGAVSQTIIAAYREIAEARRTIPTALAVGMVDSQAEVLQIETEEGIHFILQSEREEFSQTHEIINQQVLVAKGSLARFTGREGRQFGFVRRLASDRIAVAQALGVPLASLSEDRWLQTDWNPVLMDLSGPITRQLANQFATLVSNELDRHEVNWIGLRIDSVGGDLEAGLQIATLMARLDPNFVRTVAYVPAEATGVAAVVALSCDQLVMHPEARLSTVPASPPNAPDNQDSAAVGAARIAIHDAVAPRVHRDWSLSVAMIDPRLEVFQYRHKSTGSTRIFSSEEVAEQENADQWLRGAPLQEVQQPLILNGKRAGELGVAREVVDNFEQWLGLYGFEKSPRQVKPNWALDLVEALASPALAGILLMVGFSGIYLELRSPGVGIGAFVAAVAFLLFFWSKGLHGTADWLEVLLFIGGVSFILLEIFVLPGFGIFGLGGGALVIVSLILASQTFVLPQSANQIHELRTSLAVVASACVGVIVIAFSARHYLPKAPLLNHMILEPLQDEQRETLDQKEQIADYAHLVGVTGMAQTDLLPTGKARIEHELVDVIAESEPLSRGTPLVVVSARANRVIVRAVTES